MKKIMICSLLLTAVVATSDVAVGVPSAAVKAIEGQSTRCGCSKRKKSPTRSITSFETRCGCSKRKRSIATRQAQTLKKNS